MSKTIFIIDDDQLVRIIIEKMMSKLDSTLSFIQCEDGKVGLEKVMENPKNSSECIILLDLNMPKLNGWGFLDEMKSIQFNGYRNVTLYIVSSSTDKIDVERATSYAVVKKFYHKPLSSSDIAEILKFNINIDE